METDLILETVQKTKIKSENIVEFYDQLVTKGEAIKELLKQRKKFLINQLNTEEGSKYLLTKENILRIEHEMRNGSNKLI